MPRSVKWLMLTAVFAAVGSVLYALGWIGWAQFSWVLASGSAGMTFLTMTGDDD